MAITPANLSGSDLISAFRKREFELDCIQMQLVQNTTEKPVSYSGKGYIRLADDGRLQYKIYADKFSNTSAFDAFNATMAAASGKLYADSDFYTLTALDRHRNTWTAERILPEPSWPGPDASPILDGALIALRTTRGHFLKPSREHVLRLHFFDEVDLPCRQVKAAPGAKDPTALRREAQFNNLGCDFLIAKDETEITVEVQSDAPFKPYFDIRIVEALQFISARSLLPRITVRSDSKQQSLEFMSANPKSLRTHLDPPLAAGYQGYFDYSWTLFSLYLDYITRTNAGPHWHSCSYHLHNACEASANSMDAWAIGVCLAVEGISTLIEAAETKEDKKVKKDASKTLMQFIDTQGWDDKLTQRARGLVGQLPNLRVIDRLEPLRVLGHVDVAHVGAWSKLRNRQAHPKHSNLKTLDTVEIQTTVDRILKTTVLIYHIVFHLIGYTGKYVDYGTYRYPVRDYPLQVPEPPKIVR